MKKRMICLLLVVVMLMGMLPATVFAAHDSTGRPLDLTGDVYLALYIGGSGFPGEPAEHDVSGYLNLNSSFASPGFTKFAESADGILEDTILDDVVQGTSGVWGVFSITGGSHYLLPSSGLVTGQAGDAAKPHNAETEKKIIQTAINAGEFTIPEGKTIDNYTIIWYVIKYQRSDSAWHIDGVITEKQTYTVNYYGNGNTSGGAPTGANNIMPGTEYTIAGNTGNLQKRVGSDVYLFNGWNTAVDGTGTHYEPGQKIEVNSDLTLYAEWYLQNRYTVTAVTKLDDLATNIEEIHGQNLSVWIKVPGEDEYLELSKSITGTYTTTVTENGVYSLYFKDEAGNLHQAHNHSIVIYNENGRTELLNYSVSYDPNAGEDAVTWTQGDAPAKQIYHATESAFATANEPRREGYTFLYWKDQDGNIVYPDQMITGSITKKTVLTAQWEKNIDLTIQVVIDHKGGDGFNIADTKHEALLQLLREENGVNLPLEQILLDQNPDKGFIEDRDNHTTTYNWTIPDMPQGIYKVSTQKQMYDVKVSYTQQDDGNQHILVEFTYAPDSFDLTFDVVVNGETEAEKELLPKAVNVKVLYWGLNEANELGWHTITQQAGNAAPTTVHIDPETGKGTGYFPVWKNWDSGEAYEYRVEVKSFVMPDGSIVPASSENFIDYTPDGSGLYKAKVTVEDGDRIPQEDELKPDGAYFDGDKQIGVPTVTVDIQPFTVTFQAGEDGTVEGQQTLTYTNQYRYPDLNKYTAVPNEEGHFFVGWFTQDGQPVENKNGQYLTENVTYYAKYSTGLTVEGNVIVDTTYEVDGETTTVNEIDRLEEVLVVLEKLVGDNAVDMEAQFVTITYDEFGTGTYRFEKVPNDGSQYRIRVFAKNYATTYDNESDPEENSFTQTEFDAVLGGDEVAEVNVHLDFQPVSYKQYMEVDASRIGEGFRPSSVLAEVLYRDVGDIHPYNLISQHKVAPFGEPISLSGEGMGSGSYDVWQYHTNGSLYEYQMNISKLYGNVDGVFTMDGVTYNSDTAPFTIEYAPASHYSAADGGQARTLKATLIPKEYKITFDLNLGKEGGEVSGMDQYLTDSETGESYIYHHTWSERAEFDAYPYRPGYVFEGWECDGVSIVNGGHVVVGAELAEDLVLVAQWKEITDNAYVVRHLELNTDKPLKRAVVTEGDVNGSIISANECVATIEGYQYAGAMVDGKLYTAEENATMTVKAGQENIMIIYYLPDGSDGYTEQVESNLKLDKTATLENDGTYTVTMETFTKDNPITTLIQQNTPLDIVLVLDQSGSLADNQKTGLNALQNAVNTFVTAIADHGRHNEVDHRIAVVGYASNETDGTTSTNATDNPYTGGVVSSKWTNTGVFDSNGEFHLYNVKGFTYQEYEGSVESGGIYYTKSSAHKDAYLLLTYHEEYRHLITEDEARLAVLNGETVYGYVYDDKNIGSFVELTRNSSGLWLYGDKQLYSLSEFFTYHTDVWTHRHGLERREIHAYGTGSNYKETDGHTGVYTRKEAPGTTYDLSVYKDALIPVSVGANGSGGVNPGLIKSSKSLGANGGTRARYGMEMANAIFEANKADDRVRVVVMFTDGKPGQSSFLEEEANAAIAEAYKSKDEYDAYVYTIGLYSSNGVDATSDIAYYMNALSSNYPDADDMGDIKQAAGYVKAADGQALNDGVTRYVNRYGNYYTLKYGSVRGSNCWYFGSWGSNTRVTTEAAPVITGGKVGGYDIYEYQPAGYKPTEHSGYYSTTENTTQLTEYFTNVMKDITTKITQEIVLHEDTILRDIMGEGLVLRPGSVVTAYKVAGTYNPETKEVEWKKIPGDEQKENRVQVAQVTIPENPDKKVVSPETTTIDHYQPDGSVIQETNVPFITVYNLKEENPTDPDDLNYHPHTVDITGYDFENWYISEGHPNGFKMVVEITGIEATDDVQWGRSTSTNNEQSGLWLPKDAKGNRQLLLPFRQPTTIFVERAYVLDYGKEFTLSGWYFDDEDGKNATPIHVDCDIESGMNQFDSAAPNLTNQIGGAYGNTTYGNVQIDKNAGKVTYNPTSMNWGGYDQFYVFGKTWRKTVLAQTANNNGVPEDENLANLWNKVTVIPANNIYYEDSFITTKATTQNGIQGFKFTGTWTTEGTGGSNVEIPEHLETAPNGDVHGWTDSLGDDITFSDGSAHVTGLNKELGAQAEFTFTGTGVEVYSHTDANTGMIVAVLRQKVVGEDGVETNPVYRSLAMDGLAMSGGGNGYYHIPTVAFKDLPYGTYSLQLIATAAASADGTKRYVYYLDGVRIHNPLGNTTNYQSGIVKEAYELENNAVYTEVRDILLDNGSFNADKEKIGGAVFIDWIQSGQGDEVGVGTKTYDVGTFKEYGPKNEVYLNAGQAIVIKVKEGNNYYVGLKSLTGGTVKANLSGVDTTKDVTSIEIAHTTDMYYRVNPMKGYIVIQNGNTTEGQILSITNLRTTNMNAPAANGGVDYVTPKAAVMMMRAFDQRMIDLENAPPEEEIKTPAQQQAEANIQFANTMFPSVRQWLSE